MQATLAIRRYDPENTHVGSYTQEFKLEVPEHFTVLDSLIKIREEEDPSLSLRCSCRAAICGSCAMRVNGQARLACKTKVISLSPSENPITVEPMGNQRVIRDLVVDTTPFWNKVRSVQPFLQPEGPEPEEEYIAPNDAMIELTGVMGCIMCGACVSDCTALEVDSNFLGPAALAKAYRFIGDPRDGADSDRLGSLNEDGGVWDCTRCYMCVEVCPKGVAPMDRIMQIREKIVGSGITNTPGARHIASFSHSVAHSGWLDESRLAVDSWGMFNIPKLIAALPVGLRALIRGKFPLPAPFHKKRPGSDNIARIFRRMEGSQK
jgi:succinate dehydrogenase / fumarate reductase iron-sulfur subunit